ALGGCALGEERDYSHGRIALLANRSDTPTAVAVLDQRPYILSGDKRENFVGLSRNGYGMPFDVKTRAGTPMAADMSAGITRALEENGQPAKSVIVPPAEGVEGAKTRLR